MDYFVEFGSETTKKHIGYTEDDLECFHCGAIGRQSVFKSVEQGYLFFILLPIKRTQYYLTCLVRECSGETELSKEQFRSMKIVPAEPE